MPGAWPARNPARFARHDDFARIFFGERSLAKSGKARLRGELELRVVGNFDADVREGEPRNRTGNPADRFAFEEELRAGGYFTLDLEDAKAAVHLAAMALARDRLLPWVTPLRKTDVRLVEARLGGEDPVVDLSSPERDARLDPPALELLLANLLAGRALVQRLIASQHQPRLVLFRFHLDLRREAGPQELLSNRLTEL